MRASLGWLHDLGKLLILWAGGYFAEETNPDRCDTYRVDHTLMHSSTILYIFDRYVLSIV